MHIVQIFLTSEFEIEIATCECPRGLDICHHIAAGMFATRYELSKTDVACSWTPQASKRENVKTWRELHNIKKPERVSQRDLLPEEIDEFGKETSEELSCGFAWLLKKEESEVNSS